MSESAASTAVAVFVKTPGLSPVKTRLGQAIGTEAAVETYQICLSALSGLLQSVSNQQGVSPYWAVAEKEAQGSPYWSQFPQIVQIQSPGLATRLHGVYSSLRERHPGGVFLIGADCPHLPLAFFTEAIQALSQKDCLAVLGPATDGGFTFFGSRAALPLSFWESVPYSESNTFNRLVESLKSWGSTQTPAQKIHLLAELTDIDTREDLERALSEIEALEAKESWAPHQRLALKRLRSC
jgi:glycosyltransferase A (GT-A) superfamily protein (DUF2064 family)